jgi:4'-phosphopantetheinyl transferase
MARVGCRQLRSSVDEHTSYSSWTVVPHRLQAVLDVRGGIVHFDFSLKVDTVHVWKFGLSALGSPAELTADFSEHERARAAAYVFDRDRQRFLAGRRFLKTMLGRYLGVDGRRLQVSIAEKGKPYVANERGLRFNVTHCEDIYVLAMGMDEDLGIDIELDRQMSDARETAQMVFSLPELAALDDLPPDELNAAFLRGWTRKEAFVKALGVGVGVDLKAITVGLEPAQRLVASIPGISMRPIAVRSLPLRGGYLAVACSPNVANVQICEVTEEQIAEAVSG